jgi:hypothetical protein
MSFMAYSLQPIAAVDIGYWRGNAARSREGRRALRRRPYPATAGSGRFRCFALRIIGSTGYVVDAIARGYEMTALR